MGKKPSTKVEVIDTKDKLKKAKHKWEDSMVTMWKICNPIAPRMLMDYGVGLTEMYASTVGNILIRTPFWRGEDFTNGINMHEFLHWSIYPIDIFQALDHLTKARELLMIEQNIKDVKDCPYPIEELQFIQNILGDYLIHAHLLYTKPDIWWTLWEFLKMGGKFEADKVKNRDTAFQLYIGAYHFIDPINPAWQFKEQKAEDDAKKIGDLVIKARTGNITKPYAIKELTKIFHEYFKADEKEGNNGQGEPKCPKCGSNDWEVLKVYDKDEIEEMPQDERV